MTIKEKLLQKSNLWHAGAIGVFLLISCVYFYPALSGYVVEQADVKNWVGASQEIADYRESGEQVGWTNAMFSGMPATQISMAYEGKAIPDFFRGALSLWLPSPISLLFVYFLSFYILAMSFKVKPLVGIIGSIAYGLSSYFIVIIEAGHVTKALAVGYAPLLIAGFIFAYRWKNWMLGVALSALFMTFQLSANHLQITYYLIFLLLGLGIIELIRHLKKEDGVKKFIKVSLGLIVAYGVAILINYGNIKGTSDYAEATTRGGTELTLNPDGTKKENVTSGLDRDYITAWSYGRSETFTFLVPNFKGGETQKLGADKKNDKALKKADSMYRPNIKQSNQYWGDQPFTSGPVYIGAIVVLLALLALYYVKDNIKWALLVVTLLTVMLAWGRNYVSASVLLPILLYALAPFFDEKKRIIFTIANTAVLMFFIAMGDLFVSKSLTDLFLDYLPGYNKFRAVTIILVIAEICIPLMGLFFLHKLFEAKTEIVKNIKPFFIISGSLIFILLFCFGMVPTMFNGFISDQELAMLEGIDPAQAEGAEEFFAQLEQVRVSIFRADVWRSLIFVLLGAGVIFAYIKDVFNKTVLGAALGLLILVDLVMVDSRYLSTEKSGKNFKQWTEAYKQKYPYTAGDGENQILSFEIQENPELAEKMDSTMSVLESTLKDKDLSGAEKQRLTDWALFRTLNRYTNFRVLEEGNAFNSSYVSYFNKSIGGYHGAKLGRYQELIEFHLANNNPAIFDMLNMKYVIRPAYDQSGKITNSNLSRVNSTALGNAWLSKGIKVVANADEEIASLKSARTFRMPTFGEHLLLVNGVVDSSGIVRETDQISLLFVQGKDSAGKSLIDTIPMQEIPYSAVTEEMPLAFVLDTTGSIGWDYAMNVDSSRMPLLGVSPGGRAGWDPEKETVIDQRYKSNLTQEKYSGEGKVEMISYHPDLLSYSFSSPEKQLVVFSEIYYPAGWKAYVDNEEVPISCVNYVLRAVEVPAGDHRIELVYKVESYESAGTMAWIGSILILLLIGGGIYYETKMNGTETNDSTLA